MKKITILLSTIFLLSVSIFAQSKPDYSGEWTLDKSKLKSAESSVIESITIKATQTAAEIKVEVATIISSQPIDGAANNENGSQSQQVRRGRPVGDGTTVYSLGGNEKIIEEDTPAGKKPVILKASLESDGKLNLSSTRTVRMQQGEVSIVVKEIWELTGDGKTMKVTREMKGPGPTYKREMYFTKK